MKKIVSIKPETIKRKIKTIDNTLDKMERGMWTGVSTGYIIDQIAWLWKFKHISRAEMERLADRTINILENNY